MACATSKASDQPAHSDQSFCLSLKYSMSVKLLTEHHLEFLSLKGGCTGSSESTLVKMPHCWKSHVAAHMYLKVWKEIGGSHTISLLCEPSHSDVLGANSAIL